MDRYQITISRTVTRTKKVGKQWDVIEETKNDDATRWEKKHGYTPEIVKEVEETIEVYKQTVEDLDLRTVILAINPPPTN
jgi:hypothetical protein